jgi:hypothetical protein
LRLRIKFQCPIETMEVVWKQNGQVCRFTGEYAMPRGIKIQYRGLGKVGFRNGMDIVPNWDRVVSPEKLIGMLSRI